MGNVYTIDFSTVEFSQDSDSISNSNDFIDKIADMGDESEGSSKALIANGYNEAIIGIVDRYSNAIKTPVLAYSISRMLDIIVNRDGMDYDDALEYLEFNVLDAWMGDGTPIYVNDL